MTENKREELKNVKELIECGMFTEEEIMNDPKRTIKEKQMLGLLKDSKTNETIKTNEAEYTIEQLLDERDNIVDTALKDNPMLQHILNHSDNIAEAYTVLNFDTVVKNEYQIDTECKQESRMYDSIADCFYMEIRDYQTLCDLLGEKTKTGKARILQMNNWKRYFDYEKIKYSNSYIILDIYPEPLPKERKDYRNGLFVNEFKVLILTQLLQAEINDSGSIIYHTTFRKIIEKMNVVHKRFFNHNVTNMILQKINDCFDDDMIKKIRWNYQKFYSTVYRKLKDSIDYSLKQLEKDNMIKVNYYNVIFDKDENGTHKATKDEEAKILTIKKETAELLGFKNSTIATVHNADRYNNELQKAYDAKGWKYVYYEIEIITNADNLKRHINEYTALNTIQNIYDLSNTDIKKLQSKANNNMIQSLCDRLSNNQTEELKTIRDNDIDLIDYSYDDIKEMFSFGSGTYNNTDYERMYNDFVEYLIKNNYD